MMELVKSKYEEIASIRTLLYAVLIFLAFVLIIVKTLGRNPLHVKFASLLKGPTSIPIFGNSLQFLAAGREAPTKLLSYWRKKYGSIYRLWLGNDLYVVISDVDYLKDALNNRKVMWFGPHFEEIFFFLLDANNNKIPEKDTWKLMRSLQPHFLPGTVRSLVPKFNERIAKLVDYLQEKSGSEFDVLDTIFDTVFDIFTSTQFDYVMDSESKKRFDFRSKIEKMMAIVVGLPLLLPGMRAKFVRYLTEHIFLNSLRKSYHSYMRMITNGKCSSIRNDVGESAEEHHKLSYLWTMIKKNKLTLNSDGTKRNNGSIIDVSGGVILAAVESTYAMISTALLMIAMHHSVQDKLCAEIREVFGDDQRQANYEDIARLSYMDRVISETTRRNTPTSVLFRYVSEDSRIGPYTIPKGTYLIIDINGVHSDEKLYPRPWEFNPDNFNQEVVAKRSPYAFLAFSAGVRACMGQTFARTEMKLVLVEILRKFKLRTSLKMDDMKYVTVLGTQNANGYPISFVPRE